MLNMTQKFIFTGIIVFESWAFATGQNLSSRFDLEMQRPTSAEPARWPTRILTKSQSQSWVLIDGMLGDLAQTLYYQTKNVLLQELKVPSVHIIRPSSFNSMLENADQIALELNFISRKTQLPLVLIAHSRGAAETFLALLKNPHFLQGQMISKVVLVQGAFSGSPLADFVNPGLDFISEGSDLIKMFQSSAQSLAVASAQLDRLRLQQLAKSEAHLFQEKIFFVRARSRLGQVSLPLKASAIYLNMYFGNNDGVTLTEHQQVLGWGQDLGILESDHFGLLGGIGKGGISQRAFIRALVKFFN